MISLRRFSIQHLPYIRNRWLSLFAINVANFVPPLDTGIMALILPTISISLKAPVSVVLWVPLVSLLIEAAFMPIFGRLSDRSGRKKYFLFGLILFSIGSFLAGNSLTIFELLFYRIIQSFGAAFILANGRALIADSFRLEERGIAFGTHVSTIYLAITIGTAITGSIVSITQLVGWRYVFYVSGAIAAIDIPLSIISLRESEKNRSIRMDWLGSLLLALALSLSFIAITGSAQSSFGNVDIYIEEFRLPILDIYFYPQLLISIPMPLVLIAAILALALFIIRELVASEPLIDFSLFKMNRMFFSTNFSALFLYLSHWSTLILLSFYLQVVRGLDPLTIGFLLTVQPISATIFSMIGGWISSRSGSRDPSIAGLIITCIALLLFSTISVSSSLSYLIFLLIMLGAGVGIFAPNNTNANLSSVKASDRAMANGILGMMRHTGQSLSIALSTFLIGYYALGQCITMGCTFSPEEYVGALHLNFIFGAIFAIIGSIFAYLGREARVYYS